MASRVSHLVTCSVPFYWLHSPEGSLLMLTKVTSISSRFISRQLRSNSEKRTFPHVSSKNLGSLTGSSWSRFLSHAISSQMKGCHVTGYGGLGSGSVVLVERAWPGVTQLGGGHFTSSSLCDFSALSESPLWVSFSLPVK